MLISTALLLDSNIRNSVCTPAKLPCRRVEVGYEIIKWRVYFNRPNNLEDLLQRIQAEMEQISLN
jgi:hypothetical protein